MSSTCSLFLLTLLAVAVVPGPGLGMEVVRKQKLPEVEPKLKYPIAQEQKLHIPLVKDEIQLEETEKPEVIITEPIGERPSSLFGCDHLQAYKGLKGDKLEACCATFPKETFDCTSEPVVGHPCTGYHAPVCCKCTHLPPPPPVRRRRPPTTPKPKPDAEAEEVVDDTEEEDDEDED